MLLAGWAPELQSPTFTWIGLGKAGRLNLYLASGGFRALSVAVNGHPLAEIALTPGIIGSTITIPASLLSTAEGGNRIVYSARSVSMSPGALVLGYSLRTND